MSGKRNEENLEEVFFEAANHGKSAVWEDLLEKKMKDPHFPLDVDRCLIYAARAANFSALKAVLKFGPNLKTVDERGKRAIHYAAQFGPAENVEALLRAGSSANCSQMVSVSSEDTDWTPLHLGCLSSNLETARVLLKAGAHANSARGEERLTPLHIACRVGSAALLKLLLDNRAHPNCVADCAEPTPLDMAVKFGDLQMIRVLCEYGADANFQHARTDRSTTLQQAVRQENMQLIETILNVKLHSEKFKISFTDTISHDILKEVIEKQQVEILRKLCQLGIRVDALGNSGNPPLQIALKTGHRDVVEILLNAGANPEVPDKSGKFLLHNAISYLAKDKKNDLPTDKWYDLIWMLINRGITVDKPDSRQNFPLHVAIDCGLFDVATSLCEKTPHLVHVPNNDGHTPLLIACGKGDLACVEKLLMYGADVNAAAVDGKTPLFSAVFDNSIPIIEKLLSCGAKVNDVFDESIYMAPLQIAAMIDSAEVVEMLIAHGAQLEVKHPKVQETPLMLAASVNAVHSTECLLRHGADPNAHDAKRNYSVLTRAIQHCRTDERGFRIIEVLLEGGAILNEEDSEGYMPLDRCIYQAVTRRIDRLRAIKTLVEAGAPLGPRLHTQERRSPLFWLTYSGMLKEAYYLVNTGWPIHRETWINLPGKTQEQDKLHAYFLLRKAAVPFLRDLARSAVRSQLLLVSGGREILSRTEHLPVPDAVKQFLLFRDRDYCESQEYFEFLLQQANIVVPEHYL